MDPRTFPTKGNLMLAKNSLALAKQGYDLMDKKRNILIRELMDLIDEARSIQEEIDTTFTYAYQCLQDLYLCLSVSPAREYRKRHQQCGTACLYRAHREFDHDPDPEHHGD